VLPARLLPSGTNVLRFRITSPGDVIPGDDERARVVNVSEQPALVALLDPPDWEGGFLVSELADVARTTVRGYAHVSPSAWIDMSSGLPMPEQSVREFARNASMILIRGSEANLSFTRRNQPVWRWPTMFDESGASTQRDWYLSGSLHASPLAGRLAAVQWDSLPPVLGVAQLPAEHNTWIAISARQGRRGAERPALVGIDSAGSRELVTYGSGWWRWRLRGGEAREAYRTLIASGVDWLLADQRSGTGSTLISSTVVSRGEPTIFEWVPDSIPDSLGVSLLRDGEDSSASHTLRFDSRGSASLELSPGTYRWRAAGADGSAGVTVVEQYSDEYHPRVVAELVGGGAGGAVLSERFARDNWWLFVVVVVALSAEWAWRHRRGLS
jgi:hypothetical protein